MNNKLAILFLTCSLALPCNIFGSEGNPLQTNGQEEKEEQQPQQSSQLWGSIKHGLGWFFAGIGAVTVVAMLITYEMKDTKRYNQQKRLELYNAISQINDPKALIKIADEAQKLDLTPHAKSDLHTMINYQLDTIQQQ
jgi:hypothetical protein